MTFVIFWFLWVVWSSQTWWLDEVQLLLVSSGLLHGKFKCVRMYSMCIRDVQKYTQYHNNNIPWSVGSLKFNSYYYLMIIIITKQRMFIYLWKKAYESEQDVHHVQKYKKYHNNNILCCFGYFDILLSNGKGNFVFNLKNWRVFEWNVINFQQEFRKIDKTLRNSFLPFHSLFEEETEDVKRRRKEIAKHPSSIFTSWNFLKFHGINLKLGWGIERRG